MNMVWARYSLFEALDPLTKQDLHKTPALDLAGNTANDINSA